MISEENAINPIRSHNEKSHVHTVPDPSPQRAPHLQTRTTPWPGHLCHLLAAFPLLRHCSPVEPQCTSSANNAVQRQIFISLYNIILLLNVLRVKLSAYCSKNFKYSVESRGSSTYLEWHFRCFSSGRWNSCMMEIEVQFHFSF